MFKGIFKHRTYHSENPDFDFQSIHLSEKQWKLSNTIYFYMKTNQIIL